jgi:hypothetical protein
VIWAVRLEYDNHTPNKATSNPEENLAARLGRDKIWHRSVTADRTCDAKADVGSGSSTIVITAFQQLAPVWPTWLRPTKTCIDVLQASVECGPNQRFAGAEHASVGEVRIGVARAGSTNDATASPIDLRCELQGGNMPVPIIELVASSTPILH